MNVYNKPVRSRSEHMEGWVSGMRRNKERLLKRHTLISRG